MAKIMDVREFKADQYSLYKERRTGQLTKFLDKNVDFVTYYHINTALSTSSINNHQADDYVGENSPYRYNQINNMPVYGFPVIDVQNSYDEDAGGYTAHELDGTIIILQEIIEPLEGDWFVLNMLSDKYFFRVTNVEQLVIRSKPYYVAHFTIGIPDQLVKLRNQVVEEYNAIFDNIGTNDKVVISKNEFNLKAQYTKIYQEIVDYYIANFFNSKVGMFELRIPMNTGTCNYTDKFLIQFMEKNRIIALDSLLKNSFVLDFNDLSDPKDYLIYKKTIYWAIESKDIKKLIPAEYISAKKIVSPFTLLKGQTNDEYWTAEDYLVNEPELNRFYFEFPFKDFYEKYRAHDIAANGDTYQKVLALLVNYMNGNILSPGYFLDILGEMSAIEEYILIPLILYVIRDNINGLITSSINF